MISVKLIFDVYTPEVEAQITRDLIAVSNLDPKEVFSVICESDVCERLVSGFNMALFSTGTPNITIVYKTSEWWPEHPDEESNTVVMRDLYRSKEEITIDPNSRPGYYLKDQSTLLPFKDRLAQIGPRGIGYLDPDILMTWGGPTMDTGTGVF